jgi:hypothetical protein
MKFRPLFLLLIIFTFASFSFSQNTNQTYLQMSEMEQEKFIEEKSNEFLDNFRRAKDDQITPEGVSEVKKFVATYLSKNSKSATQQGCRFGDDLETILKRGKSVAGSVNFAFKKNNLPPQLGLYIAMIESEFCTCIQAPTGPLGMFQLTFTTAQTYGINAVKGASPAKPDDRCEVKSAANAAALYINKVQGMDLGNDSIAMPFIISAYNSGEGMTKKLLKSTEGKNLDNRNYWTIRSYYLKLPADSEDGASQQFLMENHKYYPKFLAAMIIGENPKSFGIEMMPLSQTK